MNYHELTKCIFTYSFFQKMRILKPIDNQLLSNHPVRFTNEHSKIAFVLKAKAAPTNSKDFLAEVGKGGHTEIIAHTLMNAIFVAQSHRPNVIVYLVLEYSKDFTRTITFISNDLTHLGGFHEEALLNKVTKALDVSRGMKKEEMRSVESGITVRTISFEKLVVEIAKEYEMFAMDKKGTPIREKQFVGNPCFVLTDHIPMQKNSSATLKRLGTEKISLGPKMLFASQCITLIHNELDLC